MEINNIRRSFFALAFILSSSSLLALELKSVDLNYTITIPSTWSVEKQDQTGFYFKSQDGKKSMDLAVITAGFGTIDSDYIARYEQVLKKVHHVQLVSSRIFTIDGVPAYENIQRLGEAPVASVTIDRQIIADGKFYDLESDVPGGDATQDSEMQEALTSFHFLTQPKHSRLASAGVMFAVFGIIAAGIFALLTRNRSKSL